MSNTLTSLIFGIGVGGWAYVMLMRNSGHAQSAWLGALAAGIVGFLVVFLTLEWVLGW